METWTDIGTIAAEWERDDLGWQIAPDGLDWIEGGAWARIGARARIGYRAIIGERARIGVDGCNPVDIGWADGYRKCVAEVDGVAYIGAGCRWFTLDDALKHWGNHSRDRTMTLALLESAKAIANAKGWKWSGLPVEGEG